MIEKYGNMTTREIVATPTPRMRDALYAAIGSETVEAPTNTSVALIDRGIVEAGRSHPLTAVGRAVVAFIWPDEVEHARLAAEYERVSGKSAAGLTTDVLRSLLDPEPVAGVAGTSLGEMRRAFTRGEAAVEAVRNPRPRRTVRQLGVWTVGDRVHVVAAFSLPDDVWTIRSLVVVEGDTPYAAIELTHREGGLPLGTTSSAVGLEWLRPARRPMAPRGTIRLSESLLSAARTGASSRGQFVEYGPMREALRAAFEAVGLRVEADPALGDEPGVREHWRRTTGDVLRKLRDDHLPSRLAACIENDEACEVRDRETDPERYPLHAADVRTMIEDVAREVGVAL